MACGDNCVYCNHHFNLYNLKNERRRNIFSVQGGFDIFILNELAIVLNTDRESLLNTLQSPNNVDTLFICANCNNLIKQHASARDKAINLLSTIRARRVPGGVLSNLCDEENVQNEQVPPSPMQVQVRTPDKSHKKRSRSALTPLKTGLTPASKKNYVTALHHDVGQKNGKASRRKGLFTSPQVPSATHKTPKSQTPQTSKSHTSPVSVEIPFKCRTRVSHQQGNMWKNHNITRRIYPHYIPNSAFLPSAEDHRLLREDMRVLIQRVLTEHMKMFHDIKHLVTDHIPHEYSEQSKRKSNVVPLGIMEKDENITEQMIDIMTHLQQYVPRTADDVMKPLLLGGDGLSVERAVGSQRARADGITPEDRLDGLVAHSEDWHGHVLALQDLFNSYYKTSSAGEKGTLFQLRNRFERTRVKSIVKDAVNDCREFSRFVTISFILLSALHKLGLESLDDDSPAQFASNEEKAAFLAQTALEIVDSFVATTTSPDDLLNQGDGVPDMATNMPCRVPCGFPGCHRDFAIDGKCRQTHRAMCLYQDVQLQQCDPPMARNTPDGQSTASKEDFKFNYSCNVLREGLMDWVREDAAEENDGHRLTRMWRFDMLLYHQNNHTKYRLLGFRLQSQLLATLTARQQHQMLHNRCINIHGGAGGNVPGDVALEFLNMVAKDALSSLRGNLTTKSIRRAGRSLSALDRIMNAYKTGLDVYFGAPKHHKPSIQNDVKLLVREMKGESLFAQIPGRFHQSFPDMPYSRLDNIHGKSLGPLGLWLTRQKEQSARIQRLRSYQ
ncbi:PREDICTED: uncharacterized protein LOC106810602 [Priapulus caudatus]|uniref:Uncharacterized protein LOC106810602 n=1 Tax=Priapulus caudatus TaxID=37621 RepID=A0ABM1EBC3_PRICU|nr:PREDICTED: uncharacterized protein LOC106810602 [Priapulus caudatus]